MGLQTLPTKGSLGGLGGPSFKILHHQTGGSKGEGKGFSLTERLGLVIAGVRVDPTRSQGNGGGRDKSSGTPS